VKNLKNIPVYPLHQFYFELSKGNRIFFVLLFTAIILMATGILFTHEDPVSFAVEIAETTEAESHPATLQTVKTGYREYDIPATVETHRTWFIASAAISHEKYTVSYSIAIAIAFSILLAAATGISGFWSYPVLFVFLMQLFLSETASEIWGGEQNAWKISPVAAAFGIPYYLFQQRIIRISLIPRFLGFAALHAIGLYLVWDQSGWLGFHRIASQGFSVMSFVVIGFLFFIGKDLVNLLMVFATNSRNPARRFSMVRIILTFLSLFSIQVLMFQEYADLDWISDLNIGLRPMHLLLISAVLTVATSQNIYPAIQEKFQSKADFAFLIGAFVLLSLSGILYFGIQGEVFWIRIVERHAIIFSTIVGFFYMAYIIYNFRDLIAEKINLYYLLMMPRRLMYIVVVFFSLMVSLAFEAKDSKKTLKVRSSIQENLIGDYLAQKAIASRNGAVSLLEQGLLEESKAGMEQAEEWYHAATMSYANSLNFSATNPKAHYNYAVMIRVAGPGNTDLAFEHFRLAQDYAPFPYAALNYGFSRKEGSQDGLAKMIYQDYLEKDSNAFILNNLGLLFERSPDPDSAITCYKACLRNSPELSPVYSNMALVYLKNGRRDEARKFFEASLNFDKPSLPAIANAFAFNLLSGEPLAIPDETKKLASESGDKRVQYNMVLAEWSTGDRNAAKDLIRQHLFNRDDPNLIVLDLIGKFESGNFKFALSQAKGLAANHKEYAALANHIVAVNYVLYQVPEMAMEYFTKAADLGMQADHLHALRMQIEMGDHEAAFLQIQPLRILYEDDDTLYTELRIESAMLAAANGDLLGAMTDWDLSELSRDQRIIQSLYAAAAGNVEIALENFRTMVAEDSTYIVPYLEMGKIYIRSGDDRALEDLPYGLTFAPENIPLKIELSRAHLQIGDRKRGTTIADSLLLLDSSLAEIQLLKAESDLLNGDTALAMQRLKRLHRKYPVNPAVLGMISDVYSKLLEVHPAYDQEVDEILYNARELNPNHFKMWNALAILYRRIDFVKESGYCALEAIRCTRNMKKQGELLGEFEKEIEFFQKETE